MGVPKFVLFEALFQILVTEMDNRMHMVDFFLHARMEMGTRRGTQTTTNHAYPLAIFDSAIPVHSASHASDPHPPPERRLNYRSCS